MILRGMGVATAQIAMVLKVVTEVTDTDPALEGLKRRQEARNTDPEAMVV